MERRIERILRERIRPAVYADRIAVPVAAWHAPGEPVPFTVAASAQFTPISAGEPWGPPWGTTWLHVAGEVPPEWAGRRVEVLVDLGFEADRPGFQCEGLAFTMAGEPVKGPGASTRSACRRARWSRRWHAYAPDAEAADRALLAKAALFRELGLAVHLCGEVNVK